MFDIGFWELALIGVVALLVVGPDRLPGLARTVGLWVGRIRRYVSTVRDDIEREIQADELRRMLDKPDELNPLKEVIEETTGSIGDAKKELEDVEKDAQTLMSDDAETEPAASGPEGAQVAFGSTVHATPSSSSHSHPGLPPSGRRREPPSMNQQTGGPSPVCTSEQFLQR